jgi:4-amino-4-deoxy-L-arabinose transferase-like glycosyltransferase
MASRFGTLPAMVNRSRVLEIILVLGFCLFLFAYGLGAFGLTGADEPRYAQIAREMLARHDWVTPVLYGEVWLEKPILYYWLAMASYKIFGVCDWAARAPSAVFATLMVLGVYRFSLRIRRGMPLDAALMTASCALVLAMARGASTDMPLAAPFVLGMLCWYEWYESSRRRFLLAFHFLIALGMLAKGPVAPFLAALIITAFCLSVREPRQIARTLWIPGVLLFLAVALPWYIEVQLRNPQFLRVFILEHNLDRFGTNMFRHPQPFWYYLPLTLAAALPWSVFAVGGMVSAIRRWREWMGKTRSSSPLAVFLLLWALLPILFFSLSRSKLPAYILPSIPACALLAALYVHDKTGKLEAAGHRTRSATTSANWNMASDIETPRFWVIGLHAVLCAGLVTGALLVPNLMQKSMPGAQALMVASVAGSVVFLVVICALFLRGLAVLRPITLLPVVLALVFLIRVAAPSINAAQSERPVARFLQALGVEADEPVALFHAKREVEYGLAFYRNQPIAVYERRQLPPTEHIVVAGEGWARQLQEMLPGRELQSIGYYRPQHLQIFVVGPAQ